MSITMSFICEFCNKEFTNIGNLNVHLKKAKYCLSKRGLELPKQSSEIKCQYCYKLFASKQMCRLHEQKCNNREHQKELEERNKIIQLKEQEIIFLKQQLEEKRQQFADQSKEIESYRVQINSILLESIKPRQNKNIFEEKNTVESNIEQIRCEFPNFDHQQKDFGINYLVLKDSYQLIYRPEDGYIDVTNLCVAGDKKFNDWKKLNKTSAFLKVLSSSIGMSGNQLLKYQSGSNSERRTWAHPQVAINIAQWISTEFGVQVSRWVYEMLTRNTDIRNLHTTKQLYELAKTVQYFERKYIQRGRRTDYPEKNVVYIITTDSRETKKEYKIGKTYNLTNRLSTYNTSEDHKVVFVQECDTPDEMAKLEKFVFAEMAGLRVRANREWFCGEVEEMIKVIKECKLFLDRGK